MGKRNRNYYYKNSCLSALDEIEYKLFEEVNDYGFNLDSELRQIHEIEKIITQPKYFYNKKYFNEKK